MKNMEKYYKLTKNELSISNLLITKKMIKIGLINGISSQKKLETAYTYFKNNNVDFVLCTGNFDLEKLNSRRSKNNKKVRGSKNETRKELNKNLKNTDIKIYTILSEADTKYNLSRETFINTNYHLLDSNNINVTQNFKILLSNEKINKCDKYVKQSAQNADDIMISNLIINGNTNISNEKIFISKKDAIINIPPIGTDNDKMNSFGILSIKDDKRHLEIKLIMKKIVEVTGLYDESYTMHKLKLTKDKNIFKDLSKQEAHDNETKKLRKKL